MIDANDLAEWGAECAAIAEDAGLLELPTILTTPKPSG